MSGNPLHKLPSVNTLLENNRVAVLIAQFGREVVTQAVRRAVENARTRINEQAEEPDLNTIVTEICTTVDTLCRPSLKPMINATGIVLHTNLGRAPLGPGVMAEISRVCTGYSNLEYDLDRARRGSRQSHLRQLLKTITGAEDVLIVNNNAAGLVLTLNTLARNQKIIVSRGELIEIGDAFRLPEIMASSGAHMVEVGATNRTRLSDYANAIDDQTALLFKAHQSNFSINGFTEQVNIRQLAQLAKDRGLPLIYDLGSGLLRKPPQLSLAKEPDVASALRDGADLVAFSCDKMLGGPQAGILAGQGNLIQQLAQAPLMRALRVGKLTLAGLYAACRHYLNDKDLVTANPTFAMLNRTEAQCEDLAQKLSQALNQLKVPTRIVNSTGQCGGGSLPNLKIHSKAVEIKFQTGSRKQRTTQAEQTFQRLLQGDRPVLAILREGRLLLDVLSLQAQDFETIAKQVAQCVTQSTH